MLSEVSNDRPIHDLVEIVMGHIVRQLLPACLLDHWSRPLLNLLEIPTRLRPKEIHPTLGMTRKFPPKSLLLTTGNRTGKKYRKFPVAS
jgi:hypothetical protein